MQLALTVVGARRLSPEPIYRPYACIEWQAALYYTEVTHKTNAPYWKHSTFFLPFGPGQENQTLTVSVYGYSNNDESKDVHLGTATLDLYSALPREEPREFDDTVLLENGISADAAVHIRMSIVATPGENEDTMKKRHRKSIVTDGTLSDDVTYGNAITSDTASETGEFSQSPSFSSVELSLQIVKAEGLRHTAGIPPSAYCFLYNGSQPLSTSVVETAGDPVFDDPPFLLPVTAETFEEPLIIYLRDYDTKTESDRGSLGSVTLDVFSLLPNVETLQTLFIQNGEGVLIVKATLRGDDDTVTHLLRAAKRRQRKRLQEQMRRGANEETLRSGLTYVIEEEEYKDEDEKQEKEEGTHAYSQPKSPRSNQEVKHTIGTSQTPHLVVSQGRNEGRSLDEETDRTLMVNLGKRETRQKLKNALQGSSSVDVLPPPSDDASQNKTSANITGAALSAPEERTFLRRVQSRVRETPTAARQRASVMLGTGIDVSSVNGVGDMVFNPLIIEERDSEQPVDLLDAQQSIQRPRELLLPKGERESKNDALEGAPIAREFTSISQTLPTSVASEAEAVSEKVFPGKLDIVPGSRRDTTADPGQRRAVINLLSEVPKRKSRSTTKADFHHAQYLEGVSPDSAKKSIPVTSQNDSVNYSDAEQEQREVVNGAKTLDTGTSRRCTNSERTALSWPSWSSLSSSSLDDETSQFRKKAEQRQARPQRTSEKDANEASHPKPSDISGNSESNKRSHTLAEEPPMLMPLQGNAQHSTNRRRALLIGCNYGAFPKSLQLPNVSNDIRTALYLVQTRYGIDASASNVLTLTTEKRRPPTKETVFRGFAWLRENATAGDSLIFYFSGYRTLDPSDTESVMLTEDNSTLKKIDMLYHLQGHLPEGCQLTCLFDYYQTHHHSVLENKGSSDVHRIVTDNRLLRWSEEPLQYSKAASNVSRPTQKTDGRLVKPSQTSSSSSSLQSMHRLSPTNGFSRLNLNSRDPQEPTSGSQMSPRGQTDAKGHNATNADGLVATSSSRQLAQGGLVQQQTEQPVEQRIVPVQPPPQMQYIVPHHHHQVTAVRAVAPSHNTIPHHHHHNLIVKRAVMHSQLFLIQRNVQMRQRPPS